MKKVTKFTPGYNRKANTRVKAINKIIRCAEELSDVSKDFNEDETIEFVSHFSDDATLNAAAYLLETIVRQTR